MSGVDGFGTQLQRGNGANVEAYITIANITSISGPGISRDTIDVTAHDSPEGWMEFLGSLKDGGEVSADLNYDPGEDTHTLLIEDLDDKNPRNYRIVFPDPFETYWQLALILTAYPPEYPYDDKMACSCTWKVSGKPVLADQGS